MDRRRKETRKDSDVCELRYVDLFQANLVHEVHSADPTVDTGQTVANFDKFAPKINFVTYVKTSLSHRDEIVVHKSK